ncbi:hypothetical protein [Isoptericola variabilis]|uniref:hypothetical protein n=1 Tax=Isoptericola variabilis TaxID=139208 RepID=UPI0002D4905F|nr:hypothetical protein [Isoptericola variabilis]TWH31552.1 hypothetical protein L600_002300000440 [Isoptericola variabilis J7]
MSSLTRSPTQQQLGADDVTALVGHALGETPVAATQLTGGERFGYTGDRPHASTWREAVVAAVEALLHDGAAWGVGDDLLPSARVRAALDRHGQVLDDVDRPVLVHVDLWDGNVLALPDADGTWRRSGLATGRPVVLDAAARTRLALYRVWVDVVMAAELPSRGKTGPADADFRALLTRHLAGELDILAV